MFAPHYLYMRQCLTVKYKTLTSLHGVIHVEVLHAQYVLVNIECVQVPAMNSSNDQEYWKRRCNPPDHGA